MSKTTSLVLQPSRSFFERVMNFLDQSAEMVARTGETVYFGL